MRKKTCAIVFFALLLATFVTVSSAWAEDVSSQDVALAFVENALPVDLTKYTVTLTKFTDMNYTSDIAKYTLKSDDSEFEVTCYIKNNVITGCNVYVKRGTVLTDRPYANLTDAAAVFLERYQTFTELDSTQMINMLPNADLTKNSSSTAGNLELTVQRLEMSGAEVTGLSWTYVLDGVGYTSLKIGFRNGVFDSLNDNRALYTVGETAVRVSKEQAIATAVAYVKTYTYAMPDGSQVSGFNVTEERTTAELRCAIRNSTLLFPMWKVDLFLNQTYPGSVDAFMVGVWADSGEVFTIGHEGPGGGIPITNVEPQDTEGATEPFPTLLVVAFSVAVAAVIAVTVLLFLKKRRLRGVRA